MTTPLADRAAGAPLSSVAEPGSERLFLFASARLTVAVEIFSHNPDLRLVPVIDAERRPVGAVFEKDLRRLLFNPYGHALMQNPSAGLELTQFVRPCPSVEVDQPLGQVLDSYARGGGREGLLLTRRGRLCGFILNRRLLELAGQREGARADTLGRIAQGFESEAARFAEELGELARRLRDASTATRTRATQSGENAGQVATAANQVQGNVAAMADRCAEVAAALDRLHEETNDARSAAEGAASLVRASAERADGLVRAASSIEEVVATIENIVRKVSMLAMNATIEAARAGEAGLGFAVVAKEVRALANQTRQAAGSISAHAQAIHGAARLVSTGHGSMEDVIERIGKIARSVDATVAEQKRVTREVAQVASEAAAANEEICAGIQGISDNARSAGVASGEMEKRATALWDRAERLQTRVATFTGQVQAA
jgi:methyl-accepting chemotaxis protein